MILIATPARLSTPRELLTRIERTVHGLRWGGTLEWRLYLNEQPRSEKKYEPNARARNELIDRYLRPEHEWVLWVDADIIEMPGNLIEVLMGVAKRGAGLRREGAGELPREEAGETPALQIVAPMVWMERVAEGPPSIPVGGWFYDTGGFVRLNGTHAEFSGGFDDFEDEIEMQSVGCVYLAPAVLYHQGLRYCPEGNEVEHLSFMRRAREAGAMVWATRKANVIHAYLPKYGEAWHHE